MERVPLTLTNASVMFSKLEVLVIAKRIDLLRNSSFLATFVDAFVYRLFRRILRAHVSGT